MDGEPENDRSTAEDPIALASPAAASRLRRRLATLPPFLLLLAALGLIAYRGRHPDWQGLSAFQWAGPPKVEAANTPSTPPDRTRPATPGPIVVKAVAEPVPAPTPAQSKVEIAARASAGAGPIAPPPNRPEPERPEATPGLPDPSVVVAGTPEPIDPSASPPSTPPDPGIAEMNAQLEKARKLREVEADIKKEADRTRLDRERLAALKPTAAANEARDAEVREFEGLKRAYQEADADRARFLEEVRQAIARLGGRAGAEIREIAARHEISPHPLILEAVKDALRQGAGRIDRPRSIEISRHLGLPEAMILDNLAIAEWKNHAARGGPKTEDEAILRAARQVLAVRVVPPTGRITAPVRRKDKPAQR